MTAKVGQSLGLERGGEGRWPVVFVEIGVFDKVCVLRRSGATEWCDADSGGRRCSGNVGALWVASEFRNEGRASATFEAAFGFLVFGFDLFGGFTEVRVGFCGGVVVDGKGRQFGGEALSGDGERI
jgi:hypothetical protein